MKKVSNEKVMIDGLEARLLLHHGGFGAPFDGFGGGGGRGHHGGGGCGGGGREGGVGIFMP